MKIEDLIIKSFHSIHFRRWQGSARNAICQVLVDRLNNELKSFKATYMALQHNLSLMLSVKN